MTDDNVVPGRFATKFAEITNPQPMCRMCALATGDEVQQEVLRGAHEMAIRGDSFRAISQYLQRKMGCDDQYARPNVTRHLRKHCSLGVAQLGGAYYGKDASPPPEAEPAEALDRAAATYASTNARRRAAGLPLPGPGTSDEEDALHQYDHAWGLYHEIYEVVRSADTAKLFVRDEQTDAVVGLDPHQVRAFTALVDTGRKVLADIHKVQTDRRLLDTALRTHQKRLLLALISPIHYNLVGMVERLRAGEDPEVIADQLDELLSQGLINVLEDAAETAMTESRTQFKLVTGTGRAQ